MNEFYIFKKSIIQGALSVFVSFSCAQGGDYDGTGYGGSMDSGYDADGMNAYGTDSYGSGGSSSGMDAYGTGSYGAAAGYGSGTDSYGSGGSSSGMDAYGTGSYGAAAGYGSGTDAYGAGGSGSGTDAYGTGSYGVGGSSSGTDAYGAVGNGGGADAYAGGNGIGAGGYDASQAAPQAAPMATKAGGAGAAALKEYFDKLEDDMLSGDLDKLRQTCQMKQGSGCSAAKNFLSACTLFLKDDESFASSGCIKHGSQRYKMNPEGFVYPANPKKNKEEESVIDHLVGQMKERRKKLAPDKDKFLKIVCTSDSLSMLENKEDKKTMEEACLEFKYDGNPPPDAIAKLHRAEEEPKKEHVKKHKGKKHRKGYHPRNIKPTIIEDKESPEEEPVPVKPKKVVPVQAETSVEPVQAQPETAVEQAPVEQAQENMEQQAPIDNGQGFGQVMEQAPQMDFGKALQAGSGLVQQMDKSGKGQQAMQGLQSFTSGFQSGAAGSGLGGAFGGMGGGEQ